MHIAADKRFMPNVLLTLVVLGTHVYKPEL